MALSRMTTYSIFCYIFIILVSSIPSRKPFKLSRTPSSSDIYDSSPLNSMWLRKPVSNYFNISEKIQK